MMEAIRQGAVRLDRGLGPSPDDPPVCMEYHDESPPPGGPPGAPGAVPDQVLSPPLCRGLRLRHRSFQCLFLRIRAFQFHKAHGLFCSGMSHASSSGPAAVPGLPVTEG